MEHIVPQFSDVLGRLMEVVKFHLLRRYRNTVKMCKSSPAQVKPLRLDIYATKFVAVYLFLKMKGSRPMTYQYLRVGMIGKVEENGGFIDQETFKTAGKYGFDCLILTHPISHRIIPLLKPQCDFVLVDRNGGQHGKFDQIMSKLVFHAIGKCFHPPTRYRRIIETQSLNQFTSEEQRLLWDDQIHSSAVAKVHYQEQRLREVTVKAHECLQKLQVKKARVPWWTCYTM